MNTIFWYHNLLFLCEKPLSINKILTLLKFTSTILPSRSTYFSGFCYRPQKGARILTLTFTRKRSMLIQHGGQHEPRAIYFPQYLALQLVGGERDFYILVLVPHTFLSKTRPHHLKTCNLVCSKTKLFKWSLLLLPRCMYLQVVLLLIQYVLMIWTLL